MSVAASPPAASAGTRSGVSPAAGETCPLCGAPLHAEQDWCLQCGAAARTRLAGSPNWKAPTATVAVVLALSLGVLAAALVKLAGGSGTSAAPATTTVTTSAPVATPSTPATTTLGAVPTTGASGTLTPGASARGALPGSSAAPALTPPTGTLPRKGRRVHLSPAAERLLREFREPRSK